MKLARGFSRQHRIIHFTTIGSASGLSLVRDGFAYHTAYTLPRDNHRPGWTTFLRHPITYLLPRRAGGSPLSFTRRVQERLHGLSIACSVLGFQAGTGISTGCPSTTPVGLALGPDLPWADQLDPGTLSQSAHTFLTCVSLLMPAFSLVNRPQLLPRLLHPAHDAPLPINQAVGPMCNDTTSAVRLSPATLSARNHLTSELLRTLSRVAASKPTSWLSLRLHILSHLAYA